MAFFYMKTNILHVSNRLILVFYRILLEQRQVSLLH